MKISKIRLTLLSAIAMITLMLSACGGAQEESAAAYGVMDVLKKVPADASAVAVLNVGQLMGKLDFNSFKQTELFKAMLTKAKNEDIKKIMEDPSAAGIATNGQFCMYVQIKGKDDAVGTVLMPISDVKALEALFEKSAKEKENSPFKNIQDAKDYKYVTHKEDKNNLGIAWSKKMLAFSVTGEGDIAACFTEIFDTKRKESILTNKAFKSDKADDHDFMFWVQSTPVIEMLKNDKNAVGRVMLPLSMAGLAIEDLSENSMAFFYDFNKGEMEGGVSYHMNKKIQDEFGGVFKDKIKTDFSKIFPAANLLSITVMGLNTSELYKIVEKRSLHGMADAMLAEKGLTLKEIMEGLDGDIAFASYVNPEGTSMLDMQTMVAAINFKKPELLDKLVEYANSTGAGIKKDGNKLTSSKAGEMGAAVLVNNVLIISNNMAVLDKIANGGFSGEEAIAAKHYKDMTAGWMGAHADYAQMVNVFSKMPGMGDMEAITEMFNQYNELESTTFTATTEAAKVMVFLKNKEENSLKVLSTVANKLYVDREKIQDEMKKFDSKESEQEEVKSDQQM